MSDTRERALGRLGVALHMATEVRDTINETIGHFVDAGSDKSGKERRELLEQAEYGAHAVATTVGEALTAMGDMTKFELNVGESFAGDDEDDVEETDGDGGSEDE